MKINRSPKLIVLAAVLLVLFAAHAQPSKQFKFMHHSTQNGLLSNQVNAIIQDSIGYIWIGTNDGLIRYDGSRFKSFRHARNRQGTLPVNQVVQLIFDHKHNLWVLLANGTAGVFNTSTFTFREATVRMKKTESLRAVSKELVVDEYGNIMLLFRGIGLLTYNENLNEFSSAYNFIRFNKNWLLNDVRQQPGTRKYWLGFTNAGIAIFNAATARLSYHGDNAENEAVVDQYGTLAGPGRYLFDSRNRVWFSTFDSLYSHIHCFDLSSSRPFIPSFHFIEKFKSYYEVNGFYEMHNGTIWSWGFKAFGYFDEAAKKFEIVDPSSEPNGIDYRFISCLREDVEGTLWIGTGNNGVFTLHPTMDFFSNISHPDRYTGAGKGDGTVVSVVVDKDSSFLIGTWPEGLFRYDSRFNLLPVGIKGIAEANKITVYDGWPSRDGKTMWLGAWPGFYAYDQDDRSVKHFNSPVLRGEAVRAIAEDTAGTVWLGMRHMGLVKWDRKEGPRPFSPIPEQLVYDIVVDRYGLLWVPCALTGLYVVDPLKGEVVMHFSSDAKGENKLLEESATAVLDYNDSTVIIASPHHLAIYNRNKKKTTFLTGDDTIYGSISALEKDAEGNIWMSTTSCLYRVNPVTRVFIEFNRDDGLINDYFMPGSSGVLPDGRIIFGAPVHFVAFNPSQIKMATPNPNIRITDLKVGTRALPVDSVMRLSELELDPSDNSLTISFATLNFTNPFVVQYKLEGLDADWKTADKTKEAVYSYLAPGAYTLRFKVIDAEGLEIEDVLSLPIRIHPPFYQTWWFYSLIVMVLGIILYWIDRQRMQRMRNEQRMRIALASNLHKDVNTTLRNINVLSEIAAIKSVRQPEQARDYLKEIQYKSRSMVVAMDDVLWSISPDNDSMAKTVERMREVADSIGSRHKASVQVEQSGNIERLKPDMKTRLQMVVMYKLILLMLIEELSAREVIVQLDCIRSQLQFKAFAERVEIPENSNALNKYIEEIRNRAASVDGFVDFEIGGGGVRFLLEMKT